MDDKGFEKFIMGAHDPMKHDKADAPIRSDGKVYFNIFRYQLLPKSTEIQMHLFENRVNSLDDLKREKNNIFSEILFNFKSFDYPKGEFNLQTNFFENPFYSFSLNTKRTVKLPEKDFSNSTHEIWPPIMILIYNNPSVQKIAISLNKKAFATTLTMAHILQKHLNSLLSFYNLAIFIQPIYEIKEFWTIVETYEKSIDQVRFELISPNMSNISENLAIDLKGLRDSTGAIKTNIEINSDDDSALKLEKSNSFVSSLAEYSAKGGGDVSFRIKGLSKRIQTSKKVSEVSISELSLTGNSKIVADALRNFLGD